MPAGPVIGERITPDGVRPADTAAASTFSIAASCSFGSRTTPPLPTWPLPTSNCGLIKAMIWPPGANSLTMFGSTNDRPMNETSTVAKATGSGSDVRWRMLVRSMEITRGSCRSDHANWP